MVENKMRAYKEFYVESLLHNVQVIKKNIPKSTKIMAVVKANAYGINAVNVAIILEYIGIDFFAVATIDEAIALRKNGITSNILILGYTTPTKVDDLIHYELTQTIVSKEHAYFLNKTGKKIMCHLKVDTGMHRLGVEPTLEEICPIFNYPFLKIKGVYSHLGSADDLSEEGKQRTIKQISRYNTIIAELKRKRVDVGLTHLQSSYGILNYSELAYDYVRPGIILYGLLSNNDHNVKLHLDLQPVVAVKAQLISKKKIAPGEYIGYGTDTQLTSSKTIGVLSIGYADGIPRNLSNGEYCVVFEDKQIPQIGRICMDMMLVDLSNCSDIPLGVMVDVLPNIEEISQIQSTITNEIISCLGSRLGMEVK
uniref:Alanine racemase n=1 Tax=Enterococcus faecalis TaxID=1351 RepID=A9LN38_ENTFL|nr:serine racemase VanT-L catalytic subunit [Enterococcus faecalis]ABX54690.1 serine racemase [Enterococcus faecalis]